MRLESIAATTLALGALWLAACADSGPLAPDAMDRALSQAFEEPSRLDRIQQLSTHLQRLDANNLDAAVTVFEREHWWLRDTEIQLFMEAWTRFDPEGAVEYAVNWPLRTSRPQAIPAAVRGWALRDPVAAAEKVEELVQTHPRIRSDLIDNLLSGWVLSGQPGFLQYIADGPTGAVPYNTMVVAGTQTRRLPVAELVAWASGIIDGEVDPELRKNLFRRVTGLGARLDAPTVAAFVEKYLEQDFADQGPRLLTERWVASDPEAAVRWVTQHVPEEQQLFLTRGAFRNWLTTDFDDAAAWIEAAPQVPENDPAFAAYASISAQRDPEGALPWAERVQTEELRVAALEVVASYWYRRDPVAAETWLQASPLDEQARSRIRRAPGRTHREQRQGS